MAVTSVVVTAAMIVGPIDGQATPDATVKPPAHKRLAQGVYAVLREGPTGEDAEPGKVPHVTLLYSQKYTESDRNTPPTYVALDTSSYVPLVLAGPPEARKDERGWTLLSVTLAPEHVKTLEAFTRAHLGGRVAIVIDGEIITMHKVRSVIEGGHVQITRCQDDACQVLRRKLVTGP
jgi:preprotein translocase subunit SecD